MTAWTDQAACRDIDPELFAVPGQGSAWAQAQHAEQRAEAEAVCAGCPVILECRIDALRTGDVDTFRGGMTPLQRIRWDKRRRDAAAHACPHCDRTFTTPQALGMHVTYGHATRCRHGHPMTPDNVFMDRGVRRCRECSRASSRATRAKAAS